jgi:hypothetical protein
MQEPAQPFLTSILISQKGPKTYEPPSTVTVWLYDEVNQTVAEIRQPVTLRYNEAK